MLNSPYHFWHGMFLKFGAYIYELRCRRKGQSKLPLVRTICNKCGEGKRRDQFKEWGQKVKEVYS